MTQKAKSKKQKINKAWVGVLLLLGLIIGLQLVVTILLGGKGKELSRLDGQAAKLVRENQVLREGLAQKNALSKIAQDVSRLNLSQPEKVIYLGVGLPVAFLPQ